MNTTCTEDSHHPPQPQQQAPGAMVSPEQQMCIPVFGTASSDMKKKKQTKAQIVTDANAPGGDPVTFSQFTEKVGKIGHLVKKYTNAFTEKGNINHIKYPDAKAVYEEDMTALMSTCFSSQEDAFQSLQFILKRSFNGLSANYSSVAKNGLVCNINCSTKRAKRKAASASGTLNIPGSSNTAERDAALDQFFGPEFGKFSSGRHISESVVVKSLSGTSAK